MSREIKFRAWDKESMWQPDLGSLPADNTNILMQYTGLKDKNGKEIYEGDIVKGISYPAVCEVVFNDGSFWLIAKDWENTLGGMSADCEVIGNIWENGDLLKGEPNE